MTSVQILYHHEISYHIPEQPLSGVIFVLTSCDAYVLEWGFPSPSCKDCMGELFSPPQFCNRGIRDAAT